MNPSAIRSVLHTAGSGAADAELLARFAASRDESAFELLVWRHAAFVQRVCKSVLRDHHAAEDAAQATFLVLARKAHTFSGRGSVVGWLYKIARRIALRAAKDCSRRATATANLDRLPGAHLESPHDLDEIAALCTEVDRLPERYRVPVLLCFFEGLTHTEAARRTGWPVGTIAGQLARAKALLSRRLAKKGVGVAAMMLGLPAAGFVSNTAQAATAFAVNRIVPGVEPSVLHLAEGAMKTMTGFAWKLTAAVVAVVCVMSVVVAGVGDFSAPPAAVSLDPPTVPIAAPVPEKKPDGERIADARQRARSESNLKQILLALHSYNDANRHLPGNITDKDGKPLLSWRVAILPYIEEEELYKKFKLDEPWDSEHNKKLLAKMPDLFRVGFEPKGETKTYYQGFAGPGTLFEPGKELTLVSVTDGTSNTIAIVEAGSPVEWTKPADIPYDPKIELKLKGPFSNVIMGATADAATHAFRPNPDPKNLRRLIEIADGEVVSFDELRAKLPLGAGDVKDAQKVFKENEELIESLANQLKDQQKVIAKLIERKNATDDDLKRLVEMNAQLKFMLATLKKETEELKQKLDGAPPPPKPPSQQKEPKE